MPATTTRLALPYPSPSDPNNVPSDLQKLANALDTITADYASGTAASRPTAGVNGRFYLATDTGALSLDNGTAWTVINASLASLLQNKGDLFVASAASTATRLAAGADGQALVARAAATNGVDYELQLGQPMNLAGTGSPTRFVGGTVSGPPASGTFAIGDFVVTQNGSILICVTAGTPGTWAYPYPPSSPPETQTILALGVGWVNFAGGFQNLGYETIGSRVFLRGTISNLSAITNGGPSNMFLMPTGTTPAAVETFPVIANDTGYRVDVRPDGSVALIGNLPVSVKVSLSGITYSTFP